jgi:hypothetical protein
MGIGDWGLGIGDWGLGGGRNPPTPHPPIPNPQSPIPNPQSPMKPKKYFYLKFKKLIKNINKNNYLFLINKKII